MLSYDHLCRHLSKHIAMETEKPFAIKLIAGLAWLQIGVSLLIIVGVFSTGMGVENASYIDSYEAGRVQGRIIGSILIPFLFLPALALLGIRQRRMWLLRLTTGFGAFSLLNPPHPTMVLPSAMFLMMFLAMFAASFASSAKGYFASARLTAAPQL